MHLFPEVTILLKSSYFGKTTVKCMTEAIRPLNSSGSFPLYLTTLYLTTNLSTSLIPWEQEQAYHISLSYQCPMHGNNILYDLMVSLLQLPFFPLIFSGVSASYLQYSCCARCSPRTGSEW